MQIRFQLSLFANRFFIINYVTLIMAQDAPKRRFLSLIFLVSCFSKSLLIRYVSIHSFFYIKERLILGLRLNVLIVSGNVSLKCFYDVLSYSRYSISINQRGHLFFGLIGQYRLNFYRYYFIRIYTVHLKTFGWNKNCS